MSGYEYSSHLSVKDEDSPLRRYALFLSALRFRYLITGGALRNTSWQAIRVLLQS